MKILLICKSKQMEVLGLMYLAAVIKQCGHDCKITDLNNSLATFFDYNPDMVGYSIMTGSQNDFKKIDNMIKKHSSVTTFAGGPHVSFFTDDPVLKGIDNLVVGESEQYFADVLQSNIRYENINSLPWPDRTDFPGMKIRDFISSRGCPHNCLTGNTIIHTIEGDFPIKDLTGKEDVKVLTRHPITKEPLYWPAINIGLRQKNAELVRVHFDDGSHIDCTPDHKFKVFRYKNQFDMEDREWDVEAKDLQFKQQVRACSFIKSDNERINLSTTRKIKRFRADLIIESIIGRRLTKDERVHHKDRNPANDNINNLVLTTKKEHISRWHPEVSERMKQNNPARDIPREVLSERAKKTFGGRKQSLAERIKRRNNQLGKNNSNFKGGYWAKKLHKPSRIKEIRDIPAVNHKVYMVEKLGFKEDVYCMEVPGIHWFYANKVLVHNCAYCYNHKWAKMHPQFDRVRVRDPKDVCKEIEKVNPEFAYFQDSCFAIKLDWLEKFNEHYCNIPYHCHLRPKQVNEERVKLLYDSNCASIRMALESASDRLRRLMNRPKLDTNNVLNASKLLKENEIKFMIQNILAIPTSTIEDDLDTLEFNIRCQPDYAWSSIFAPYPGTVLGDMCIKNKWFNGKYADISDSFFNKSVLNFSEQYKEQVYVLQKIFALCVETQYLPKPNELYEDNLPKLIHTAMRKLGDSRMYRGIL